MGHQEGSGSGPRPRPYLTYCVMLLPALPASPTHAHARRLLLTGVSVLLVCAVAAVAICIVFLAARPPADASPAPPPGATTCQDMFGVTTASTSWADQGAGSFIGERLVPRATWHAKPPLRVPNGLRTPVRTVIVQHTATESCANRTACAREVAQIQDEHMVVMGWYDIGYSFLVGGEGSVFEGRGWDAEGAHTLGWNNKSIGVAAIGSFDAVRAPAELQQALCALLEWGVWLGKLAADFEILGACQVRVTASPGALFMQDLRGWPHWSDYCAPHQRDDCCSVDETSTTS